ncbi:MAG: hypothetical protein AAF615_03545 [Pseudomonadota bacterium]
MTRGHHQAVDGAASGFDLAMSDGVAKFLAFLADGITAVERRLETLGAEDVLPCYPLRTRRHLLPPSNADEAGGIDDEAGVWGALYVLEGSRLGGRMLARSSAELKVHPAFQPDTFWPVFLEYLELAHRRMDNRDGMAVGAAAAFDAFLPRHKPLPSCDPGGLHDAREPHGRASDLAGGHEAALARAPARS